MDAIEENALMWLYTVAFQTAEQEAIVDAKMAAWSIGIEAYTISIGGDIPWRYLNYADPSQDPLGSYVTANVDFIRRVVAKYDTKQIF
jgi:hypothetical protein